MSKVPPTKMEMRVAKAFLKGAGMGNDWRHFVGGARAAIREMREPTHEMWNATNGLHANQLGDRWRSMIDAASPPQDDP